MRCIVTGDEVVDPKEAERILKSLKESSNAHVILSPGWTLRAYTERRCVGGIPDERLTLHFHKAKPLPILNRIGRWICGIPS